jgi:FkbH-like protein
VNSNNEVINALHFPLDVNYILRKKKYIKKELLDNRVLIKKNIAILGGSTTSEVKNILELFLLKNGIEPSFYESDYNKYYEDAVFGGSELNRFNPDVVYIHTTSVNIHCYPKITDDIENSNKLIDIEKEKYKLIWSSLSKYNCTIIQNNFDFPNDRSLGNLDCYSTNGKTYFINQLNLWFSKKSIEIKNLHINDINYLSSYIGLQKWFSQSLWCQAKYAISMECIPELAFNISKIINSLFGKNKKCLILDLDNTCWGGIIGDEGINGICIGVETPVSEAHYLFQKYIKELKDRGVILAVCSKNDFENAKKGFDHPDSILKFDDFVSFRANWSDKPKNILEIAKEINIDLNSMVFIDDSPVERDAVLFQIPDVSVPDIGSDISDFIKYIDRSGYFEPTTLSGDDIKRNNYYKENNIRLAEHVLFKSYDDFLESLNIILEVRVFSRIYLDRITQLINKTNQFNLTTKRLAFGEVEDIYSSDKYIKIYGKLKDKFGDNGLISVIICKLNVNYCHINLWLMSCRVLKRGVEFAMFDELVRKCLKFNVVKIVGYYYKSDKNTMVSSLYKKLGFTLKEEVDNYTVWELNVENYKNKNTLIEVLND